MTECIQRLALIFYSIKTSSAKTGYTFIYFVFQVTDYWVLSPVPSYDTGKLILFFPTSFL